MDCCFFWCVCVGRVQVHQDECMPAQGAPGDGGSPREPVAGGGPLAGCREMPAWLSSMGQGLHGRRADEEFPKDTEHWENVAKVYLDHKKTPIDWSTVRNIMDMDAHYGRSVALPSQGRERGGGCHFC